MKQSEQSIVSQIPDSTIDMESIWKVLADNIDKYRKQTGKNKGFTKVPNMFIEDSLFSAYEKMVAIVINKHQMKNNEAWPSHNTIAKQAGCSISTVKKAIKRLQLKGILYKARLNGRNSNTYRIRLER